MTLKPTGKVLNHEYALYISIDPLYKHPVLCRVDGNTITPLVRLVPVRGGDNKEAVEVLKRVRITLEAL